MSTLGWLSAAFFGVLLGLLVLYLRRTGKPKPVHVPAIGCYDVRVEFVRDAPGWLENRPTTYEVEYDANEQYDPRWALSPEQIARARAENFAAEIIKDGIALRNYVGGGVRYVPARYVLWAIVTHTPPEQVQEQVRTAQEREQETGS